MYTPPLGYFITFRTYGSWLRGDDRGSVDRKHNQFGTPTLPIEGRLTRWEETELKHPAVELTTPLREVIDRTIRAVCDYKGWALHALNVRTNHVHAVVTAANPPEFVMNAFKSWATRRLVEGGHCAQGTRIWSRHGSTIYLFKPENFQEKCRYVREGQ